jgi:hypothetical protein
VTDNFPDLIAILRDRGWYNPQPTRAITADDQRRIDHAEDLAADRAEQRQWSTDREADQAAGVSENRTTIAADRMLP